MPCELYWDGDCQLVKAYRQADEIKTQRENQRLHLQGLYFYEALCDVAPVLNAFSKQTKPNPYPSRPYPITAKQIKERKEEQAQSDYNKMIAKFSAWVSKTNAQIALRGGTEESDGNNHRQTSN